MNRRKFLALSSSAFLLGGCAKTIAGSVHTYTLNIQQFCKYSSLLYEFSEAALGISFIADAIAAPELAIIVAALASADAATKSLETASGGKLVVTIDTASTKAKLKSIVLDLTNAVKLIAEVIAGTTSSIAYPIFTEAQKAAKSAVVVLNLITTLITPTVTSATKAEDVSSDIVTLQQFITARKI